MAATANAQTADGQTPAAEDICTKWGMTGKINGLCNAYCEAMDCDAAKPQASEQACTRLLQKIETALGDKPFPTCQDVDNDGVPNGIDNCPNTPNADQADAKPSTPEGDACEPVACPCDFTTARFEAIGLTVGNTNVCGEVSDPFMRVGQNIPGGSQPDQYTIAFVNAAGNFCNYNSNQVAVPVLVFLQAGELDACRIAISNTAQWQACRGN